MEEKKPHTAYWRQRTLKLGKSRPSLEIMRDGSFAVSPAPGIVTKTSISIGDEVKLGPAIFRLTAANPGKNRISLELIGCNIELKTEEE